MARISGGFTMEVMGTELWIWITMHDDRDYDWDAFLPVDIDQKHGLYNLLSKRAELKIEMSVEQEAGSLWAEYKGGE